MPTNISCRDALTAVLLAAAGAVMAVGAGAFDKFPGDERGLIAIQDALGGWYGPIGDFFNEFLHDYGVPLLWAATVAALVLLGRRRESMVFVVIAPVGLLTYLLKVSVGRPRPDGSYGSPEYTEALSFPSCHTTQAVAFFGFWFLLAAELLRRRLVVPVRGFCVAAMVVAGLSRVWAGAHWPSDVAGGVVWGLAFVFGLLALRPLIGTGRLAGS